MSFHTRGKSLIVIIFRESRAHVCVVVCVRCGITYTAAPAGILKAELRTSLRTRALLHRDIAVFCTHVLLKLTEHIQVGCCAHVYHTQVVLLLLLLLKEVGNARLGESD